MRSAEEAVAYARALHALVRWIGICDGNMQEGSFRCDANVSVRPVGTDKLGTRREIKNLNSFRFLQQAIEFEANWQIETLENGGRIEQATVLFNPDTGETRAMRFKEDAHDYRYFPDPDLLPLEVSEAWIERVRGSMPELPQARYGKFIAFGLLRDQAIQHVTSREAATFALSTFTGASRQEIPSLSNWITGPLSARLNEENLEFAQSRITPEQLRKLIGRIDDGTISGKMAKEVFDAMWASEGDVDAIIEKRGLKQISDSGELERICDQVIAANPRQVEDYRAGKEKAFNSLVGQAMRLTKGKANPQQVNDILKRKLSD
jgi:aspartyl-tRNA(Asn)/glutamyl-tRNA(Gln) amidotransferase subunit B